MTDTLVLASGSEIRAQLLRQACVPFTVENARIDEETVRRSLEAEGAHPRDVADALAEAKARKVASRHPDKLVLGCDQVLALGDRIFTKPETPGDALAHLKELRGQKHMLLSAAVLYEGAEPIWRQVGVVRLWMRDASDDWLSSYVERNWDSIRWSVGGYKLEEEGVRLFTRIEGDYFTVLGLPLLELLSYLTLRGTLPS